MKKQDVLEILRAVESGRLGAEEAFTKLKLAPFEDIGFAKVDHHREMRQGVAEVIYGAGKTPEQIARPGRTRPCWSWRKPDLFDKEDKQHETETD